MDCVELPPVFGQIFQCIPLVELVPAVVWLRFDVYADNVESSPLVAFCTTAGPAEQVK
jgi:hypothetical protein